MKTLKHFPVTSGFAITLLSLCATQVLAIPVGTSIAVTEALPSNLLSQVNPGQDRLPPSPPDLAPLPEPEVPPAPSVPPSSLPANADTPFPVIGIDIVGSTVFEEETLRAIAAPYENRTLTLRELQQLADELTQRYLSEGYLTSRAIIPVQTLTGGVVQIQVIEGGIEEIQVQGSDRLQDYIRVRIAQAGLEPVNQFRLEDQLRLLRIDPLFESVEASLRSGSAVGKSLLIVRVTEAPTIGGSLFSDNYSSPQVGDVRIGAGLQFRNLAGLGDTFFSSATWTTTAGSKVYELGYRVPISPSGGTLLLRATPNEFEITNPDPQSSLGTPEGSTEIYEVVVRQPLIRSPREELGLSFGYRYRQGSTLIGGVITDDSTVHVISFGQDYVYRSLNGAWVAQSQFRLGENQQGTTFAGPGDTSDFFSWIGQVQRIQRLGQDHLLLVKGSVQLTPDALPGSEQFFAGGGLSVRGYDQNQRFGDNGVRFSIEDQIVLTRTEAGLPFVQLAPFVDAAYVWADDENPQVTDNNFMLGTGVGLLINLTDQLNARADFAYPLIDIQELPSDNSTGLRFYFNLGYQF